jgi:hypothetical protein
VDDVNSGVVGVGLAADQHQPSVAPINAGQPSDISVRVSPWRSSSNAGPLRVQCARPLAERPADGVGTTRPESVKVLAIILAIAGLVACGDSDDVELIGVIESRPGVLEFMTSCAEEVSVHVEESADEVRISDVVGSPIDGDCGGGVVVELDAPLDGRAVVVDGERWKELAATCPVGRIGPPEQQEEPRC